MSEAKTIVYIVDDDRDVRSSTGFILGTLGMQTRPFANGRDFVDSLDHLEPGCILLDIRMPEMDGVEVLGELAKRSIDWPVIVMTGHGEISLAVQTMRMGAIDFLEKPFAEELLQSCLARASQLLEQEGGNSARIREAKALIESLTARELDILEGLMDGLANKDIAQRLQISLRTAEMHRANMMQRLGAKGLAEALRLASTAGMERQSRNFVTPQYLVRAE